MRKPTGRSKISFRRIVPVVILLAASAAYPQPQSPSRSQRRSEWRQSQSSTPSLGGQSDFGQRMMEDHARRMQEMQQQMEEMQRQAEESRNRAIQQTLRASDEQWRRIRPKLDHIERLKAEAEVSAGPNSAGGNGNFQGQGFMFGGTSTGGGGAAFGSGSGMGPGAPSDNWSQTWTMGPKNPMETTPGESLCQDLLHLLQGESVEAFVIAEKVAALRQIRAKAREDLAKARQELRGLVHPNQEPALVVMGYLD